MIGRLAVAIICVTGISAAAGAQSIRGRVLYPDSSVAPNIAVTAIDASGRTVGRALSATNGSFTLPLPAPSRVSLRALRLGFMPTVVRNVPADGTRDIVIVLTTEPIELSAIRTVDMDRCRMKASKATAWAQLWSQARLQADASVSDTTEGSLLYRFALVEGTEDREGKRTLGVAGAAGAQDRHRTLDTLGAREVVSTRVFTSPPVEELESDGYTRRDPDGRTRFEIPTHATILSDQFLRSHCFDIDDRDVSSPNVVVRFRPMSEAGERSDIEGRILLSRLDADIRRIEFSYTNVLRLTTRVCDEVAKRCEEDGGAVGAGGWIDYVRLPSGELVPSQWEIRTPPVSAEFRPIGYKGRIVGGRSERCYRGRDCFATYNLYVRVGLSLGSVAAIYRNGSRLYDNAESQALLNRVALKRAKGQPIQLTGTIIDEAGQPVAGAVVRTLDRLRASVADSLGQFSLTNLPNASIGIVTAHDGYVPMQFQVDADRANATGVVLVLKRRASD